MLSIFSRSVSNSSLTASLLHNGAAGEEKLDNNIQQIELNGLNNNNNSSNIIDEELVENNSSGIVNRPASSLGYRQLKAILWKNYLLKKRNWLSSLCELIAPLIMISILIIGWAISLNHVEHHSSAIYANATGILQDFWDEVSVIPIDPMPDTNSSTIVCFQVPNIPNFVELCLDTGNSVELLSNLLGYSGPITIPTLDEYIATAFLLQNSIKKNAKSAEEYDEIAEKLNQFSNDKLHNFLFLGKLIFTPNTKQVKTLIQHLNATYPSFSYLPIHISNTESEAIDIALRAESVHDLTWAVISFNELNIDNGVVDYTIRTNYTAIPSTSKKVSKFNLGLDDSYQYYFSSGFLTLQNTIDSAILALSVNENNHLLNNSQQEYIYGNNITIIPFPVAEYEGNKFYSTIGPLLGLVWCLCTIFPISRLVRGIVEEKESKTKETMKMMGLKDWVLSVSWIITASIQFILISLLVSITLKLTVFQRTNFVVLFLLFTIFVFSEITLSFMVSVFFSKAKSASVIAPILLFALTMPRYAFFQTGNSEAIIGKTFVSFLSPSAFNLGADLLMQYEGANLGLGWKELFEDEFSLGFIMIIILLDTIIYAVLAWYFEQVIPNQYGTHKHWLFLFKKEFWRKCCNKNIKSNSNYKQEFQQRKDNNNNNCDHLESVPESMEDSATVKIRGLRKVFSPGIGSNKKQTVAIQNLDLELYKGQIISLLGHNGGYC